MSNVPRRVQQPTALAGHGVWLGNTRWLYAVPSPHWHAYALWGSPAERDIVGLIRLFEQLEPMQTPHAVVADVRHLRGVPPSGFAELASYVVRSASRLRELVTDAWILHDSSWVGALAAGFFGVTTPPFPVHASRAADAVTEALQIQLDDWLAYEEISSRAREGEGLRLSLEDAILASPQRPTLEGVARVLGLSARSLQRRLHALDTTLPREITRIRVRRAQSMLVDRTLSITEIALTLGFATPEHFATAFREATGETPSNYRTRTNGGTP